MSYKKHTWQNGEEITASKLNHMEDGIAEASNSSGTAGLTTLFGADIDNIEKISLTSMAFYVRDGYDHAPFDYGLIIKRGYPDKAFFGGEPKEQLGISLDVGTKGKCYARTVAIKDSLNEEYTPESDDWNEVSYTKDEIDELFGNITTDIDLTTCTTVTSGTANVTAKAITATSVSAECEVNVVGNVELTATVDTNMAELIINGESYVVEPGAPLTYSGNVTEPISVYVGGVTLTFEKFVKGKPLDERVEAIEQQVGNFDAALDAAIALCDSYIGGAS